MEMVRFHTLPPYPVSCAARAAATRNDNAQTNIHQYTTIAGK